MKPNFALDLTHDGIGLLHRGKGGWILVGEVSLTDPELPQSLSMIRQRAADLDSSGLTCKLIIPPSQILFTSMMAGGADDATRVARIREGLVGLTPYPVEELVFDWYAEEDLAHVAVIARETLQEAEAFAQEHRLNPVSAVARPHGSFTREAFFGQTSCAETHLRPGATVERERVSPPDLMGGPIAPLPLAPSKTPESPQPTPENHLEKQGNEKQGDGAPASNLSPSSQAPQESDAKAPAEAVAPPELAPFPPAFEPEDRPDAARAPASTARPKHQETAKTTAADKPGPGQAETDAAPAPSPTNAGGQKAREPDTGAAPAFSSRRGTDSSAHPTPSNSTASSAPTSTTQQITPRITVAPPAQELPEPSAGAASATGAPRVQETIHVPVTAPEIVPTAAASGGKNAKKAAKKPKGGNKPARRKPDGHGAKASLKSALKGITASASALGERAKAGAPKPATAKQQAPTGPTIPPAPAFTADETSAPPSENAAALPEESTAIAPPPPSARGQSMGGTETRRARTALKDEAEALTVFGARKEQAGNEGPKYLRMAFMLGLLLILAVLAVWSMFYFSDRTATLFPENEDPFEEAISAGPTSDTTASASQSQAAATDLPAEAQTPEAEFPVDSALAEAEEDGGTADTAQETATTETASPPPQPTQPPLTKEAAQTRYAATGIWERAPEPMVAPTQEKLDTLYIASIDPVTTEHDAVALPPATIDGATTARTAAAPPLPKGTRFDLDERGLVRATPEGSLTPEGAIVFAGPPAKIPAPRPDGIAPAEPEDLVAAAPAPTLPGIRPRLRPDGLIENSERALFGGRTRAEMAALRPAPRPETPRLETQSAEDQASNQASIIAQVISANKNETNSASDAASNTVGAIVSPTERAVARSPEPPTRPGNFDKVMAQARADASDGSVVVAAAPRGQSVAPRIPTRASVAKQATIKNGISLRKVSLIGIYGSTSKPRALVRLPSGRFVKVGVGDRLDGGRVISISKDQLIYKKGSRSRTLKVLPFS